MKAKNFIFISLLLFIFLSAQNAAAEFPEASVELAKMYITYDHDRSFFLNMNKISHQEYKSLSNRTINNEIAAMKNREIYTQEQAEQEIKLMIESGLMPDYILSKGEYKYDGNINAVCPEANLKLRSQPNHHSRIITELYGGEVQEIGYIAYCACSYLGEWKNPKGDIWVAVEFQDSFLSENDREIGWLEKNNVRLVTNGNINEISNVIDEIKKSSGTSQYYKETTGTQNSYFIEGLETVSAEELAKEFDNNPFKAEKNYKGKIIKISGKIDNITMKNGFPAIQLSFSPKILCLVSSDDPLLTEIDRGDNITIEGKVYSLNAQSKSTEGITMTECKIISQNKE